MKHGIRGRLDRLSGNLETDPLDDPEIARITAERLKILSRDCGDFVQDLPADGETLRQWYARREAAGAR